MTNPTRRSMRHDIVADSTLHMAGMPPVAVTICNISHHGLVIDSLTHVPEGEIVHVELGAGRPRAARCVWQDGFRTALNLLEPFSSEDYWHMLKHLAQDDEVA